MMADLGHTTNITRRERLNLPLYLGLKKRKVFKYLKVGPFELFLKVQFVAKCQENLRGEPFGDYKKTFKKNGR